MTIHKLHIIRGDKVIDVLAGGQTFLVLRRENNLQMAMLDGTLTAAIQPEGLQVGDIIDLAFTTRRHDPVMQGLSQRIVRNMLLTPVRHLSIREIWPNSKKMHWREAEGLASGKLTTTHEGSELLIDMIDARPIKVPNDAPARFGNVGQLEVTEFENWSDVSALMTPLYDKAGRLTPDSPLKAEVAKIAAASDDPKQRAAAALRLVEDNVRYLFLGMDNGGYIPANADRTWSRRFGDCKGKTALLLALLHELGIESEAALVSATHGDGLDARLPLVHLFDHVIVRAKIDGKIYWLDGTRTGDRNLDELEVPPFEWALPVQASGAVLEKLVTHPFKKPQAVNELRIDASAGLDAPAPAHAERILRGDEATVVKLGLGNRSGAEAESFLRNFWTKQYDWIDIKKVTSAYDEVSGEERLSMDGSAKMLWKLYRGEIGRQYEVDGSRLGWKADFTRESGPHQDAPFKVQFPFFEKSTETIILPNGGQGFRVEGADVNQVIAGFEFKRTSHIEKNMLTMTASTKSVSPEFPYADAAAAKTALRDLWDVVVWLKAPPDSQLVGPPAKGAGANPTTVEEFVQRGAAYQAAGDIERAFEDYDHAVRMNPGSALALGTRGYAYLQKNDIEHASIDIDSALKINPDDVNALHGKVAVHKAKGQFQLAIDAATHVIELNPNDATALVQRGEVYAARQDSDKALADFDAAIQMDPSSVFAYFSRAQFFMNQGNVSRALGDAAKLVELIPGDARSHEFRAFALYRLGRMDEARREYDTAIGIKPSAGDYLARAETRGYQDQIQKLADIDIALRLNPQYAEAYQERAKIYIAASDGANAIKALDQAIQIKPNYDAALRLRANAYAASNRYDLAIKDLNQILSAHPDSVDDLMARCRYKAESGGVINDALGDCAAATKIRPASDEVIEARAYVYQSYRQFDRAIADYDAVLSRRPNSAIAHFGRGVAEISEGQIEKGKADLVAARKADPRIDMELADYLRAPAPYQATNPQMLTLLSVAPVADSRQFFGGATPTAIPHPARPLK